jgi:polyhydroxyalkanoate synthesis regulator phasin
LCGATLQKFMSNPLVQAFFVGRAIAEVINERVEVALTDALSELGKFDAEAKEQLRQFTEEVIARANRAAETSATGTTTDNTSGGDSPDLQTEIDELRAEIALLRSELQKYRNAAR